MMPATVVPSFGAWLYRKLVTRSPPAPGMLRTMMAGLPGMCRDQCRAITRAALSMPSPSPTLSRSEMVLPV